MYLMNTVIAIACDHAAVELKNALADALKNLGKNVMDLGVNSSDSVDYPDQANAVCAKIESGAANLGILICGSGIGMSIAANRNRHIRAALCRSGLEARLSRQHNNANVLCLGARIIGVETAKDCVMEFLTAEFQGGRHQNRIDKMS